MSETLNKTMKAVAIDRFGGIETLKTQELPIPDVGADEVRVRVEAAGVGVWDPFEREGGFAKEFNVKPRFPLVLGSDGAGTVDAVGDKVRHFKKGDRVYGIAFLESEGGILFPVRRGERKLSVAHPGKPEHAPGRRDGG